MSELRSAIESLRAEPVAELPDARIEEDFEELHRAVEQLEAERLRRLAEIDRRRLFERDGHLSAAAWLVHRFHVAWGAARDLVRVARGLSAMPRAREAVESGDLSLSAARVLATAQAAEPEAFVEAENLLVDAARIHSVADLGRAVAHWRRVVERERGIDPDEAMYARRRFFASVLLDGMVRVDGDLDPETGESLLTALRAAMDAEARSSGAGEDPRTPAQRRADALGEVCRQWLDRSDRPMVVGERPHVTLTVDVEHLRGQGRGSEPGAGVRVMPPAEELEAASGPGEGRLEHGDGRLEHAGLVGPSIARRLACDASVMRVVMAGPSRPLDVGRRTKIVPPALRRAVIVRDRTCRFPGCDRPHAWCDAHHVRHWADGGPTSLDNLLLLCRRHHRAVHRPGGISLDVVGGRPTFRRPDGSVLGVAEDGRAPP
jgi:hypothetical protein